MLSNKLCKLRFILIFAISSFSSYLLLGLLKTTEPNFPSYAIFSNSPHESHLAHVIKILEIFGYKRTSIESDWNLLWAHDYPFFNKTLNLKYLKPNQYINHFPGCGFITNKVTLSTSGLPFLPVAFKLPNDKDRFTQYINANNGTLFVEKHNEHRFIKIKGPKDINLDSNNSFLQEFIQKPYLVDGYKFDIGIYVLITSLNPLLVYKYNGDILFRFCTEKYYPFDKNIINKYVVADDYLPIWEVPSLKKYLTQFSGGMRSAFDAYVRNNGQNPMKIWNQVDSRIRETILYKENDIMQVASQYKHRNFFDLVRFDMIVDDEMKVYLMEVNMSPNLSSAHFKENALLYEQLLYSTLNVVGTKWSLSNRKETLNELVSAEKNLAVGLHLCTKHNCHLSCNEEHCELCMQCLTGTEVDILRQAHREHLHRTDMARILPVPIMNLSVSSEPSTHNISVRNKWLHKWFLLKCEDSLNWCN